VFLEVAVESGLDDDESMLYEDDDDYVYNQQFGIWQLRPEWMHPECVDPSRALEHGTCCKYPADALVTRALYLAEAIDQTLTGFDDGNGDCARTARRLICLIECAPRLIGEIREALPTMDRTAAEQLLCPVGRLDLLVLELSLRSGCPMACTKHAADRRPGLGPFVPVIEECQEALWAAVLPRPLQRRRK
jgi:hypothetical protein